MSADKYTSYKSSVHSPYSKIQDDIDPYSPVIVEDLLQVNICFIICLLPIICVRES